jgi:hypothetical protein
MRSSALGMSPLKMAIAVAVTMAATAGTGCHEEGDRHQQRGGHRRGQARDGADEQAIQRRQCDDQQHIGLEDQAEGSQNSVHAGFRRRGRRPAQ